MSDIVKPTPGPLVHLAVALAEARRNFGRLARDAALPRPGDLEEAYAVADAVTAALGGDVAGFKVGASGERGQRALGLAAPFWGAILREGVLSSPAALAGRGEDVEIEAEIVLRLGRDLEAGERFDAQGFAAVLDGAFLGIEVNRPSWSEPFAEGGLALIADKGVNRALVLGAAIPDWRARALGALPLRLEVPDGAQRPISANEAGFDPLAIGAWLAGALGARGRPLRAGRLIATGAVGQAAKLRSGQTARVFLDGEAGAALTID